MPNPETGNSTDERERLANLYDFGLTYSATYSSLIVAAVFGVFGILLLIQAGDKPRMDSGAVLPLDWVIFSVSYFIAILLTLFIYARTLVYSRFIGAVGQRLASTRPYHSDLAEEIYREACMGPGSNFLTRAVYRTYPSLRSGDPTILMPAAAILFIALWLAASIA